MCYEDEGVYVNTYGRITKDVVLQWGEMPTSVGMENLGKAALVNVEPCLRLHVSIMLTLYVLQTFWLPLNRVVGSRW